MADVRIPSVDDLAQVPLYSDDLRREFGELLDKLDEVEKELSNLDETSRAGLTKYLTAYRKRAEGMRNAYGAPPAARAVTDQVAELGRELGRLIDRAEEEVEG